MDATFPALTIIGVTILTIIIIAAVVMVAIGIFDVCRSKARKLDAETVAIKIDNGIG